VQSAIDQLVESGAERGVQVAVYREGELVVDAVSGVADPVTGRPVMSDTPFYNFSMVKAAASTIVHMLVERGSFGYDTRVAQLSRLEDAPRDAQSDAAMAAMPPDLPMFKAAPMSLMPTAVLGNRADILAADIPAGGKTSARAIARMYGALLDEVDGVRLLSPERLRESTAVS